MSFKDTLNAVFPFAFDVRKKRKCAHFVLEICTFRFRDYTALIDYLLYL